MVRQGIVTAVLWLLTVVTAGAERPPEPKQDAPLIVSGTVREVYTSDRESEIGYLVEIDVEEVERGEGVKPGDVVYAHCFQRKRTAPRVPAAYGHRSVPVASERIKAYLYLRSANFYEGAYPDWYDRVGTVPPGPGSPPRWSLGVYVQPVATSGRGALVITGLVPGGPAQRAGLEVGDQLLEAGGNPTRTAEDLARAVAGSQGSLRLLVRDVRTGRESAITVALAPR